MGSPSRALALALALTACTAEPREPVHVKSVPAVPPSPSPPALGPAPLIPSAPPPAVDESPVPPRPRVDEKTLLLESVHVHGDRIVFPDEAEPLADALAAALADPKLGGYKAVPPAELRESWSEARLGKLPNVAFVCESAPTPFELSRALYPGASTARATIVCPAKKGPCRLEVVITAYREPGKGDDEEGAALTLELPRTSSLRDWAARIRKGKLVSPKPKNPAEHADLLGMLRAGGMQPGVYVSLFDVTLEGPWKSPFTDKEIDPIRADLVACKKAQTKRWRDFYGARHLLEIGADGKVTRCESNLPERTPPPEFDCQCAALRKLTFGTAKGTRRASFDIFTTTVGAASGKRKLLTMAFLGKERADDPTAVAGSEPVSRSGLEDCLVALDKPFGELSIPVRFVVGADGKVKKHKADWPSALPAAAATCMDAVLAEGWFNCPIAGHATIDATLDLTAKNY